MNNHKQAVATLLALTLVFLVVAFFAYKFNMPAAFTALVAGAFGNFSGALLLALKTDSNGKDDATQARFPEQEPK